MKCSACEPKDFFERGGVWLSSEGDQYYPVFRGDFNAYIRLSFQEEVVSHGKTDLQPPLRPGRHTSRGHVHNYCIDVAYEESRMTPSSAPGSAFDHTSER